MKNRQPKYLNKIINVSHKKNMAIIKNRQDINAGLLEALKVLIDRLNFHGSIDVIREEEAIEQAREAITKAEGR